MAESGPLGRSLIAVETVPPVGGNCDFEDQLTNGVMSGESPAGVSGPVSLQKHIKYSSHSDRHVSGVPLDVQHTTCAQK